MPVQKKSGNLLKAPHILTAIDIWDFICRFSVYKNNCFYFFQYSFRSSTFLKQTPPFHKGMSYVQIFLQAFLKAKLEAKHKCLKSVQKKLEVCYMLFLTSKYSWMVFLIRFLFSHTLPKWLTDVVFSFNCSVKCVMTLEQFLTFLLKVEHSLLKTISYLKSVFIIKFCWKLFLLFPINLISMKQTSCQIQS